MDKKLTSAQKKLIGLLNHRDVADYFESLKKVHQLATYCVDQDMIEPKASSDTHELMDILQLLSLENNGKLKKP